MHYHLFSPGAMRCYSHCAWGDGLVRKVSTCCELDTPYEEIKLARTMKPGYILFRRTLGRLQTLRLLPFASEDTRDSRAELGVGGFSSVFAKKGDGRTAVKRTSWKHLSSFVSEMVIWKKIDMYIDQFLELELSKRELRVLKRLLCIPHGFSADDDWLYMEMPRCSEDSYSFFGNQTHPEAVKAMVCCLSRQVFFLNQCVGVAHRDIKPSNIGVWDLTAAEGDLARALRKDAVRSFLGLPPGASRLFVLIDFNAACCTSQTADHNRTTVNFAAPECFQERFPVAALDIWSLAVTLHTIVFRKDLFVLQSTGSREELSQELQKQLARLLQTTRGEKSSPMFDALFSAGLTLNPKLRSRLWHHFLFQFKLIN